MRDRVRETLAAPLNLLTQGKTEQIQTHKLQDNEKNTLPKHEEDRVKNKIKYKYRKKEIVAYP